MKKIRPENRKHKDRPQPGQQSPFTVLRGGRDETGVPGRLLLAEATDTRMMGVTGLHLWFEADDESFHQLLYLDFEEYGFDDYISFYGDDENELTVNKANLFGALGGRWVRITLPEAVTLTQEASAFNIRDRFPLPEGIEEYRYLLEAEALTDPAALRAMMEKVSGKINTDFAAINYYLMRLCAMDYGAAAFLTADGKYTDVIRATVPSSLMRCASVALEEPGTYRSEALVEDDSVFYNVVAAMKVENRKVTSAELVSRSRISPWEASLILKKEEFVLCGKFFGDAEVLRDVIFDALYTSTENRHEVGTLYMVFRSNNDHVARRVYRLDADTTGMILVLDSGELVIAAYTPTQAALLETQVLFAMEKKGLYTDRFASYRFADPIIGAFLDSGFETFSEFVSYIQGAPEE